MLWVLTTEPDQSESAWIEGEKETKNTRAQNAEASAKEDTAHSA